MLRDAYTPKSDAEKRLNRFKPNSVDLRHFKGNLDIGYLDIFNKTCTFVKVKSTIKHTTVLRLPSVENLSN